ncbi:hypothetical protein BB561_005608 [Smittium simulii]|uniref:Trehalase n=1 Tax=Smittium simulii TaxID=133385 RepID=A0A2T9Y9J6_9FUNG|nr:hypothetical protein BB561_005608 [Smittium simulii]
MAQSASNNSIFVELHFPQNYQSKFIDRRLSSKDLESFNQNINNFLKILQNARIPYTIRNNFTSPIINAISLDLKQNHHAKKIELLDSVKLVMPLIQHNISVVQTAQNNNQTIPNLNSTHMMTRVLEVHSELGLFGDGIKIAVIDTGIDYLHPSLGGCFGRGCKISGGFNFVESDGGYGLSNIDSTPYEDCIGHGTHVAGIIAAQDANFVGVAPNASLNIYRIFGCNDKDITSGDVVLKALIKAFEDGNDIINMSFGSSFSWAQYLDSRVSSGISEHGVIIVSAFGNSGEQGMWSGGSPSLGTGVIAVGSVDTPTYYSKAIEIAEQPNIHIELTLLNPNKNFPENSTFTKFGVKLNNEFGCGDYNSFINGDLILVNGGECDIETKINNAKKFGATGIFIIDKNFENNGTISEYNNAEIPVGIIEMQNGKFIYEIFEKFNQTNIHQLRNEVLFSYKNGGQVSKFSSIGPGPLLEEKPDILAPGGNIYSTYLMKSGGYKQISGTSMASPYISGVAALWLQNIKKTPKLSNSIGQNNKKFTTHNSYRENYASLFKSNLKLCGVPIENNNKDHKLASVAQQGAGLVDALCAVQNKVSVMPTQITLGDAENHLTITKNIVVKNKSEFSVKYNLYDRPAESISEHDISGKYLNKIVTSNIYTTVEFNNTEIQLNPGEKKIISIKFTLPDSNYTQYWIYSGHIILKNINSLNRNLTFDLSIPYLGIDTNKLAAFYKNIKSKSKNIDEYASELQSTKSEELNFQLNEENFPVVILKLDHPTSLLQIELINSVTRENMGFIYPGGISTMLGRTFSRGFPASNTEESGFQHNFIFTGFTSRLELINNSTANNGNCKNSLADLKKSKRNKRYNILTFNELLSDFMLSDYSIKKNNLNMIKRNIKSKFDNQIRNLKKKNYALDYSETANFDFKNISDCYYNQAISSKNITELFISKSIKMNTQKSDSFKSYENKHLEKDILKDYAIKASIAEISSGKYYFRVSALGPINNIKAQGISNMWISPPTLKSENEIIQEFKKLGKSPTKDSLENFVKLNFGDENSLLKPVEIHEWVKNPPALLSIKNKYIKGFANVLNSEWKKLIKAQDKSKLCKECSSTLLDIEGPFIVPGGRFREFYYWDTYFIIEGLLISGLYQTSKDIIYTLASLVKKYGFVPNGSRQYYLNRSQPPLLAHMAYSYYNKTSDKNFVFNILPYLKLENEYWVEKHTVEVKFIKNKKSYLCKMFRYTVNSTYPRPESYSVDYLIATNNTNDIKQQHKIFSEIATGAESGYDYSSRWISNNSEIEGFNLSKSITSEIIPSDLNSIMYRNQEIISQFCQIAAESTKNSTFRQEYLNDEYIYTKMKEQTLNNIMEHMYDKSSGMFNDYNINIGESSKIWSLGNLWPYWYLSDKVDLKSMDIAWDVIFKIIKNNSGGLPVTLFDSGLQWDYPSVWPPLQYVIVKGLISSAKTVKKTDPSKAQKYRDIAFMISNSLVGTSFCAWHKTGGTIPGILKKHANTNDTGHIFEKFNSTSYGNPANIGEYKIQSGFGWTNGVLLWMIDHFKDKLETPKCLKDEDN